jgi:hypothetical protein
LEVEQIVFVTEITWVVLVRGFSRGDKVSERIKGFVQSLDSGCYVIGTADADPELDSAEFRRVDLYYEGHSQFAWASLLNNELERCVRGIVESEGVDIMVANDWSTATAARVMSEAEDIPFSVWLHSTEHTRGFMDDHSEQIHSVEERACRAATNVLVSDSETRSSAVHDLGASQEKILEERPQDLPEVLA